MASFDGTTDAPLLTLEVDGGYLDDFTLNSSELDGAKLLGPNESWTALSMAGDVWTLATRRGRSSEDQTTDAGELVVELDNSSGEYDPDNGASTYSTDGISWFRGALPVRLRATWDAVVYDLFTGRLEDAVTDQGSDSVVTLTFLDGLASAAVDLPDWVPLAETTAVRAGRVLDAIGWPSSERDLTGSRTLLAITAGTTGLGVLEETALAEGGRLHVTAGGLMHLSPREDQSPKTVQVVFTDRDTVGASDYDSLKTAPGLRQAVNVATVSDGDDPPTEVTVTDINSVAVTRTTKAAQPVTAPLSTTAQLESLATYLATRRSIPSTRVQSVTTEALNAGSVWPALLGVDLGSWVQVQRTGTNGLGLDVVCAVEGLDHTISVDGWQITVRTAPVDVSGGTFTLDTSLLSGSDLLSAARTRGTPVYLVS